MPGSQYDRVIPARFGGDSDDLFMRSVFNNYAREGENKDTHVPTGQFFLKESDARALSSEVLATHKNIKGDAQAKHMDAYFAKAWGHFDVNKTG